MDTWQGADLQWEALIIKAFWSFNHVAHMRSLDILKSLYFHYQKMLISLSKDVDFNWQGANLWEEV